MYFRHYQGLRLPKLTLMTQLHLILKGMVTQKLPVIIYSSLSCSNLYYVVFLNTKDVWKNVCNQSSGSPLTTIVGGKNTIVVNGDPELFGFPHFLNIYFKCSA